MKVKEIIDFYYAPATETIEVSFRMKGDPETQMREAEFDLSTIKDYGYFILDSEYPESKEFRYEYSEDTDELVLGEDLDYQEEVKIDKTELKNFISEYYSENQDFLPELVPF
jgi:hypothetical protein